MPWSPGSTWNRWDAHVHAPGTLRANGYGDHTNPDTWAAYFARIRSATPSCAALGITDYFVPRGYRLFVENDGRAQLPGVFVFANIELRLKTKTDRGHAPNVHLLVCPDDPAHLKAIESKLAGLEFVYGEKFRCTEDDLRRLGRAFKRDPYLDDEGALRVGASQFLVEYQDFADLKNDSWVAKHVLFAVPADHDGLGGFAKDSSFTAHREEVGALADIVFSGQPNERKFWLGEHPDFAARGYTRKPTLHGSDAHEPDSLLVPKLDRRCWIRSAATFDGLRQTIAEPERRVWIGPAVAERRITANVIRRVRLRKAPWFVPTELELNDGLVTVIGSRGSGKTALAELIALAADASDANRGPASFLGKARGALGEMEVELVWGDGSSTVARADDCAPGEPRVRYLSQQFVERLSLGRPVEQPSNSDWDPEVRPAVRDELLDEIERVVFDEIAEEDRLQCDTFAELRDVRLARWISARDAARDAIHKRTDAIAGDHDVKRRAPTLKSELTEAKRAREALEAEIAKIPMQARSEHVRQFDEATARRKELQDAIADASVRVESLQELSADLDAQLASVAEEHSALREKFGAILDATAWDRLRLRLETGAERVITEALKVARNDVEQLRVRGVPVEGGERGGGLEALTRAAQDAKKVLGEDAAQAKKRSELGRRLEEAKTLEKRRLRTAEHAEGADARIHEAHAARLAKYEEVFATVDAEVQTLESLYAPLRDRLGSESKLSNLEFRVGRHVDLRSWARAGERIFDLRTGPFQGRGSIEKAAAPLLEAWGSGTAQEVRVALARFHTTHVSKAMEFLHEGASSRDVGQWLFSTDHISVRYDIAYEKVPIANLSPGARGVVLLTLFLAVDQHDERPLVIDQPEDNLDPSSIYASLVPFFRDAAVRRQIVMVTHNANLVVNTDSDQVIVATSTRPDPTQLPNFSYEAGGLEDARIRERVCEYLEGGEEAFRRRGARYGSLVQPRR